LTGEFPEISYADAEGVSIAYCVRGDGPIDLVRIPGVLTSILAVTMIDPVAAAPPLLPRSPTERTTFGRCSRPCRSRRS
jgi:hypothetical protein